ncbi:MAG: hypothetical protein KGZ73_15145, partial [Rhizobiales bacterium]|nr:hypothetical protein [Hyphomicrobiales bacterium]
MRSPAPQKKSYLFLLTLLAFLTGGVSAQQIFEPGKSTTATGLDRSNYDFSAPDPSLILPNPAPTGGPRPYLRAFGPVGR